MISVFILIAFSCKPECWPSLVGKKKHPLKCRRSFDSAAAAVTPTLFVVCFGPANLNFCTQYHSKHKQQTGSSKKTVQTVWLTDFSGRLSVLRAWLSANPDFSLQCTFDIELSFLLLLQLLLLHRCCRLQQSGNCNMVKVSPWHVSMSSMLLLLLQPLLHVKSNSSRWTKS